MDPAKLKKYRKLFEKKMDGKWKSERGDRWYYDQDIEVALVAVIEAAVNDLGCEMIDKSK